MRLKPSPSSTPEILAFSIVAQNVQITTTLASGIVYVRMVLGLLGVWNPNPTTELADSRFIGYTSNPKSISARYSNLFSKFRTPRMPTPAMSRS